MGYRYLCDYEGIQPVLDESGILKRYTDPLWDGYLARISPSLFRARYEDRLPDSVTGAEFNQLYPVHLDPYTPVRDEVTYPVRAAARYAVEENWRVSLFYNLISGAGENITEHAGRLLGELMVQAHEGYSSCGLGSPATDQIVEHGAPGSIRRPAGRQDHRWWRWRHSGCFGMEYPHR